MAPKTAGPGDIESTCPACGQNSVQNFDRLDAEAGFVCTGCGKTVTIGIDQITKVIKAGQKAGVRFDSHKPDESSSPPTHLRKATIRR
jgi:hypothetical protein